MELLKKIKEHISDVPDQQGPVLRIGGSGSATAQIMLYSSQKTSSDVAPEAVDSHALGKPWKNSVLTVDLEYSEKPKLAVVQILGEGLKGMIARNTMSIDRILWVVSDSRCLFQWKDHFRLLLMSDKVLKLIDIPSKT